MLSVPVIVLTIYCLIKLTSEKFTTPPEFSDDENYDKCRLSIIETIDVRDITLVIGDYHNNKLLQRIHSMNFKTVTRTFLAAELKEPNQAYILQCDNLEECENGLDYLVKDGHWNPNAMFIVVIKNSYPNQEVFFEKLHRLYVFKTVLVMHSKIFLYNFDVGDHCTFSSRALTEYDCESLTTRHFNSTPVWIKIKKSLQETTKIPYSQCNMSVVINAITPFIFPPVNVKDEPIGLEEEFIDILKRIGFKNIFFSYILPNKDGTGTIGAVNSNLTVLDFLTDLQRGNIDYFLGGTLLSAARIEIFDFTVPHWYDEYVLVVTRATHKEKWKLMLTVFKPLVWIFVSLIYLCVIFVAHIFKRCGNRNWHIFFVTALETFGYLTNNVTNKKIGYFIFSWVLFAWLITCFYQCNLSNVFTNPAHNNEVDSFDEILKRRYKLYIDNSKYNFIKETYDNDMNRFLQSGTITETAFDSLKIVANKRKTYTISSRIGLQYFESFFLQNDGEAMLHSVTAPYCYLFRTGYLRKGNPNLKRIRILEQQVIAFGLHLRSLLAYTHKSQLQYHKLKKNYPTPLSIRSIAGLFKLFFCGCGFALFTFVIEIALYVYVLHKRGFN